MEHSTDINVSLSDEPIEIKTETIERRRLLQMLAAAGGAVVLSNFVPGQWVKPVIEVGYLPAHAQVSQPTSEPTSEPTPQPTSEPTSEPTSLMTVSFGLYLRSDAAWAIPASSTLTADIDSGQLPVTYEELDDQTLDPNVTPNQHVRVDLMTLSAAVDDVDEGVLQNIYITDPGGPLESPYQTITSSMTVSPGQQIRLRFAEVDNLSYLNVGIDNVAATVNGSNLITNGGFEADLTGWSQFDNNINAGSWFTQSGVGSPLNGFPVAAPPEGDQAAMSDQDGPGTRIIYQDITIPG